MHTNRLLNLISDNATRSRAFKVEGGDEEATIYLYDAIDPYWGIAAADFVQALNAIKAPIIHLRINSPGGDVFEARAVATAVREHSSKIIAHIDGLAASAVTYVALAAREVEMSEGAFLMIHQAWTIILGNSDEMLHMADLLDKIDASIAADYQRKTKQSLEQIDSWMADETWFTAQEALGNGFIDRIAEAAAATSNSFDKAQDRRWNLAAYKHAPTALLDPQPPVAKPYDREMLERRLALYTES